jgi:hypothetical protein
MRTSARGVRHPQRVVIMALPWCGGRTRAPCGPSLAAGGPVPLSGGEGRGGPGRESGSENIVTTAGVVQVAVPPRTRYAPGHAHPRHTEALCSTRMR